MGRYLEMISEPAHVKKLTEPQLEELAAEVRSELIGTLAKTGGHLGPNLGVVELTIAMHKVFATPKDKFVWDVSHQCYVHKLLTGRQKKFNKIKKDNHHYLKLDALEYLKTCNKKFDFYFYDALHTYEYQYEALSLATPLLNKGALIMIDDICWNYSNDPIEATKKFLKDNLNDYKLLLDVRTKYNKHPTFWNGYFIIEKIR